MRVTSGVANMSVVNRTSIEIKSPNTVTSGARTPDTILELPIIIAHWASPIPTFFISESGARRRDENRFVEKIVS